MMAPCITTVSSVVDMVDISEVKNNRHALLDSSFTPEEQKELEKRHIRSTAGVLALKQALCSLIYQTTGHSPDRKELLILRLPSGRPTLKSMPDHPSYSSFLRRNLFLSISHSRKTAYGLAVYQETTDE